MIALTGKSELIYIPNPDQTRDVLKRRTDFELAVDRLARRKSALRYDTRTGQQLYKELSLELGGDKEASLWLKERGIPGLMYWDGFSRKKGEGSRNFVIWDVDLLEVMDVAEGPAKAAFDAMRAETEGYEQNAAEQLAAGEEARGAGSGQQRGRVGDEEVVRGRTSWGRGKMAWEGRSLIELFKHADASTAFHELAHHMFRVLVDVASLEGAPADIVADVETVFRHAGVTREQYARDARARRRAHEFFAQGFETYLSEGTALTAELKSAFERIRQWMIQVYNDVVAALGIELTPEMREVYDRLLATPAEIDARTTVDALAKEDAALRERMREEAARERGQWERDEGAAPRPRGAVMARVRTASGTEIDVRYRVVSAGDLVASHGENGGVNEAYPKELQPRQRGREASIQQIHQMAASLDPELLGENRLASDGAPIVGPDSVVESGNGRVMAIRRAYRTGKGDGYRAWLTQNAERFGIDPADVEAIADPVLIRERTSDVDRVRFVQEANQSSVSRMSKTEQALADAQRISPEMLVDLAPDADIASAANRQFVQQFLEKVVGDTEMGALMDARGELSQDGHERIVNALFAYAYGDTEALSRLRETLGDDTKTVTNALLGISPRMADMEGKMRQGGLHAELSLREALMEAANELAKLKRDGKTVAEYLAQGMIFSEGNISPEARAILQFFEANKRSAKAIRAGLARYVDLVEAQGSPAQISVFGDGPMSREELVYEAFGHEVGKQYASAEEIARELGYGKDEGLFQLAVAALGKAKDKVESYAQGMWHGSQYVLEGMKFLLSKIGTGEGTQWEGWGAYLAQLRDVAGEYRTAGQELDPTAEARRADGSVAFFRDPNTGYWRFPGQDALVSLGSGGALGKLARALDAMADGTASGEAAARLWEETVAALEERAQEIRAALEAGPDAVGPLAGIELGRIEDALAGIDGMGPSDIRMIAPDSGPGNLYMVEGPDDDILMAWHDPLDAQPENVKEAIEAARAELDIDRHMYHRVGAAEGSPYTGRDLYHALARRLGGDKEASLWLKDHGVPGHRYLDDWSNEGDPDATYNFVIWDVDLLKVLDVEGPGKVAFDAMREGESYGQDVLGGAELDRMTVGQIDAVRARYEGTDQWMKAPNGEPTKLSEKQWLQVRTAAFKEWFGDWENDPANASKVVDANGEPLVVWH
ncbi:MAG: hypothetical protein IJR14_04340, partial [Synergistaceae bacterium]|nr:hypothetical protein [Synergistaceae bacterium]